MAQMRVALAVVLAFSLSRSASAACDVATNCTSCAEDECSATEGCYDNSPEDYDPAFCSPLMDFENGEDDGFMAGGCTEALGIGAGGAFFFAVLPMVLLFACRKKAYSARLISAPESEVTHTQAVLKDKYTKTTSSGEGGSTTHYYFKLEFVAKHTDGTAYDVKADVFIDDKVYSQVEVGGQVEVVFPVNNERKFEVLSNLTAKTSSFGKIFLFLFFGCFSLVGLIVGAVSVFATDCDVPWGPIAFVPVTLILCALAYFLGLPALQKLASFWQTIEVRPAANSAVLQATVVGTA